MLAAIGIFVAFTRKAAADSKGNFLRFLAFYTLTLTAIYSAIAYKTPWCLLGFWHGVILLAGVGAVAVWHFAAGRWWKMVVAVVLLAGAGQLAFQAWRANGIYSADRRNPYVYAQTSANILELVTKVDALAQVHPQGKHLIVNVSASGGDYWPLPWYLRAFDQTGWWAEIPGESKTSILIASPEFATKLDENKNLLHAETFQLRPGIFFTLYVEPDLWRAYLAPRTGLGK